MKSALLRLAAILCLAAATASFAAPRKILVVTVTTGFRHASIPTSEKVLAQLAAESGGQFTVDFVQQPPNQPKAPAKARPGKKGVGSQEAVQPSPQEQEAFKVANEKWLGSVAQALQKLSPANLKNYDAVAFISTTGDLPLPDKQGFLDWIAAGHAFVGVHAATDTFHGFPAFVAMIGGEFLRHGPQVQVDCLNRDPAHAATKPLPAVWTVFDEIYQFKNYERAKVRDLLSLDKHPNDKTPGHYPVAWCKQYGQGRVFYTSLGHRDDIWDPAAPEGGKRQNGPELSKLYQQHVLGGILWSLGLAPGDAKPQFAE
jgi:type 1 glutamine amidotransferase